MWPFCGMNGEPWPEYCQCPGCDQCSMTQTSVRDYGYVCTQFRSRLDGRNLNSGHLLKEQVRCKYCPRDPAFMLAKGKGKGNNAKGDLPQPPHTVAPAPMPTPGHPPPTPAHPPATGLPPSVAASSSGPAQPMAQPEPADAPPTVHSASLTEVMFLQMNRLENKQNDIESRLHRMEQMLRNVLSFSPPFPPEAPRSSSSNPKRIASWCGCKCGNPGSLVELETVAFVEYRQCACTWCGPSQERNRRCQIYTALYSMCEDCRAGAHGMGTRT